MACSIILFQSHVDGLRMKKKCCQKKDVRKVFGTMTWENIHLIKDEPIEFEK